MTNKVKDKIVFVSAKSDALFDAIDKELHQKQIRSSVHPRKMNIFGLTTFKSIIKVFPDNIMYVNIGIDDVAKLVNDHFIKNQVLKAFQYNDEEKEFAKIGKIPFYHKQLRVVLRNSGIIDPESIEDYFSRDGYKAIAKVIADMSAEEVVDELKKSGLRGRGGGGFPTWMKWNFCREVPSKEKYVVCNADEGDPGAYMDRSVLEGDPHSVIEGMMIAAFTIGASQGYMYVRAEYPLAIKRLERAINDAKQRGLLGNNILGTSFSFDIEIRLGAGAFVCGEETALIASVEGLRGMPRPRPPYPSVKGVWNKPTIINNVETLANIPVIFLKGGQWYSKIGTDKSKGTKVFALTGKVTNTGLVEVPMGVTLRDIVFDAGGDVLNNKGFKAIQTGGPSGGVIPAKFLDTTVSYEDLQKLGSIMGSGGMIVIDEDDCMVDIAKFYLQFTEDESCGRCAPCRGGAKQMLRILSNITEGKGKEGDIELLKELGHTMKIASLCGLGQTAPNPVLSTLNYYEQEYKDHIYDKKCTSGKCSNLLVFSIDEEKCIGCHVCAIKCPVNAISGERKAVHVINQNICVKCGECYTACKFDAVKKK